MRQESSPQSPEEVIAASGLWAAPDLPFLPTTQTAQDLAAYLRLLLSWNKKINLTACHDAISLMRDLVQDSFFLVQFLEKLSARYSWRDPLVCDLGAGAGLPGIPLRLFWSEGQYIWVERRQKRALFLENVQSWLKLPRFNGWHGDATDFLRMHSSKIKCIISRAFMPWQKLLPLCTSALAVDGILLIMANEPPPTGLASGWALDEAPAYRIPAKTRYLWALRRARD